jgi:hypothetical protein
MRISLLLLLFLGSPESGTAVLRAAEPHAALALLEARCVGCHGPKKLKGGLDLSTREGLLKGGDSGKAVVPGRPKESLLYKAVARLEEPFMPPKSDPLPAASVATIAAWIEAGAPYAGPLVGRSLEEVHWAFRPLRAGTPLEAEPAPAAAPKRTLVRRLTFDLHGLPPTPEEVETFVNDPAPDAYERLVDRLLASPRYGERWARHWLDVARYADSEGYRFDRDRKHSWPYRDFVIRALNDDLPFDTFVRWQLAGDEVEPSNPLAVAATGFLTCGPLQEKQSSDSKKNQERNRYDELDDMVSTTASAFLGLTLGCARCHDHKFDPISQREYYRVAAAFIGTRREDRYLAAPEVVEGLKRREAEYAKASGPLRAKMKKIEDRRRAPLVARKVDALPLRDEDKEILKDPESSQRQMELQTLYARELEVREEELREAMPADERAVWDEAARELRALERSRPTDPLQAHVLTDTGSKPAKAYLLARGEVDQKTEEVTLGFLSALGNAEPGPIGRPGKAQTTFQRAALADWMTDVPKGAGRLLARVIVNRVWQHHFGEGLVRTPNDFGSQGELPTRPELLESLASELVAGGWRLKALHRRIVRSALYRAVRQPVRLEAEALRDSILSVSGCLNPAMGGPGVKVPIPAELIITRTEGEHHYPRDVKDGPEVWRRSVYTFIKRSVPLPLTDLFDAPSPSASCGRRVPTTVAPQALLLLHDPFVRARARDFAARLRKEAAGPEEQAGRAFALALGRAPSGAERAKSVEFLREHPLENFCQVLFGLNEFLYVD